MSLLEGVAIRLISGCEWVAIRLMLWWSVFIRSIKFVRMMAIRINDYLCAHARQDVHLWCNIMLFDKRDRAPATQVSQSPRVVVPMSVSVYERGGCLS